jgi:hypothetical protein
MYESENYQQKVLVCGGSQNSTKLASDACFKFIAPPTNSEPLTTSSAEWIPAPSMPRGRLMPDAVILPDGTILVTNGASWGQAGGNAGQAQYAAGPVFETDLYDPKNDTWKSNIAQMTVPRLYHSGALLLSDGSVVTVGSEMQNYKDVWGSETALPQDLTAPEAPRASYARSDCWPVDQAGACTDPYEYRVEHFIPSYLTKGSPRPKIVKVWNGLTSVTYNSTIGLEVDPSVKVKRVTFVRYSTTTHSLNTDQRLIEPIILFNNGSLVVVRVPPNGNIAPPGNWYIFALGENDVPSVAQTVLFGKGERVEIPVKLEPAKTGAGFKSKGISVLGLVLAGLVALLGLAF